MQYVYLIQCQKYHKIGIANDVENRLAQLSTGNPYPLTVVYSFGFQNAEVVEKALHQKFEKRWERGEWFSLIPPEIEEFNKICEMLGGISASFDSSITDDAIKEAEDIQDFILDDPDVRIEKRCTNGEIRGFALRERNKERKLIRYIGKRENPFEFEKMMELIGLKNPTEAQE